MLVHRPRRPLAKLALCLACATLASCELPHAIAAEQPFVPIIPPSRPPVVVVLTAPIPLPRWAAAAAAASPTPHFAGSETTLSGTTPTTPAPSSASASAYAADSSAAPAAVPPITAIEKPKVDSASALPDEPRTTPAPTPDKTAADPVIQIATPAYLNRPAPAPVPVDVAVVPPASLATRGTSHTSAPAAATPPVVNPATVNTPAPRAVANVTPNTVVTPPVPAPEPSPAIVPVPASLPAASIATDKPVTVAEAAPQNVIKPSTPIQLLPADAALPAPRTAAAVTTPLPGLPPAPAKTADTTAAAVQTTTVVVPQAASPVTPDVAPTPAVPPADPLAVKLPPPAATETASVEIAPVPAAEPAPSPLQVTNGRFAGMPLPNLPALTPEPNPATDDAGSPAAALQTARNDDPLTGPLPARPSAAPMSQADETTAAQAELRRASERTGLDSLQLARIEESRRLIVAGNTSLALELTHRLNGELDAASTTYVVKGSENLWQIAEQPQVYGNAYLWPLIWRANAQLKQPTDVKPGMRLRIPTRPAVLDVTEAIDYARRAGGEKMAPVSAASTAAATP